MLAEKKKIERSKKVVEIKDEITLAREEYAKHIEAISPKCHGNWHPLNTYKIPQGFWSYPKENPNPKFAEVRLCGMITGCGIVQMSGVASIDMKYIEEAKKVFEDIKDELKEESDGAGCIVATLGEEYWGKIEVLEALGFKEAATYANYQHGEDGEYQQKVFVLTH